MPAMYKIWPCSDDCQVKTYWCADYATAQQVVEELEERYQTKFTYAYVPKQTWSSGDEENKIQLQLGPDLWFSCTRSELQDALHHSRGNVVKIGSPNEIFCFAADDILWQQKERARWLT